MPGYIPSRTIRILMVLVVLAPVASAAETGDHSRSPWQVLEPGLELGEFRSPQKSDSGDSIIRVLRIDPERFSLRLMNASATPDGKLLTAREWVTQRNLVAAINASMYQTDYRTSVSLMKTKTHTNNPWLSKDRSILAFNPLIADLPGVQIIDRECDDFPSLREKYGTLVQSIRMISCRGKNVWTQQPKKWSTAAIGTDEAGKVLFVHVRSPYSTHDLINILLALPLGIRRAMYTEGGLEAQLSIRAGEKVFDFVGSQETGYREVGDTTRARPIPNVIGVVRKKQK